MKTSPKVDKPPFFHFYPRDWLGDQKLKLAPLKVKGFWIEMLAQMWLSAKPGYLPLPKGVSEHKGVASILGIDPRTAKSLLRSLSDLGVIKRNRKGVLYSKRLRSEYLKYRAKCCKRSQAAKIAAEGRWRKPCDPHGDRNATRVPDVLHARALSETDTDKGVRTVPVVVQHMAFAVYGHLPVELAQWYRQYPPAWVPLAIEVTGEAGKESSAYTRAILERWRKRGAPDVRTDAGEHAMPEEKRW